MKELRKMPFVYFTIKRKLSQMAFEEQKTNKKVFCFQPPNNENKSYAEITLGTGDTYTHTRG